MPELPEVETVAAGLRRMLGNSKITKVICHRDRLRDPIQPEVLQRICKGARLHKMRRRGKYMIWELDNGNAVLVHLGMSGRFCKVPAATALQPHQHVIFVLDDGHHVRYQDTRRFGLILPIPDGAWQDHPRIAKLGAEPLPQLDANYLKKKSAGRNVAVKKLLMDQTFVVGVGNIYANEALFRAGISPFIMAAKISKARWNKLAQAVAEVLEKAIAQGGTTLQDGGFVDLEGKHGLFQLELEIYGRAGEDCRICGREIRSENLGGRSTFYCEHCQK